jgi:hypothetical protein
MQAGEGRLSIVLKHLDVASTARYVTATPVLFLRCAVMFLPHGILVHLVLI